LRDIRREMRFDRGAPNPGGGPGDADADTSLLNQDVLESEGACVLYDMLFNGVAQATYVARACRAFARDMVVGGRVPPPAYNVLNRMGVTTDARHAAENLERLAPRSPMLFPTPQVLPFIVDGGGA